MDCSIGTVSILDSQWNNQQWKQSIVSQRVLMQHLPQLLWSCHTGYTVTDNVHTKSWIYHSHVGFFYILSFILSHFKLMQLYEKHFSDSRTGYSWSSDKDLLGNACFCTACNVFCNYSIHVYSSALLGCMCTPDCKVKQAPLHVKHIFLLLLRSSFLELLVCLTT